MGEPQASEQIPVAIRRGLSRVQKFGFFFALAFVVSFLVGAWWGDHTSPGDLSETQAVYYLANNAQLVEDGSSGDVVLRLDTGVFYYVYSAKDHKVDKRTLSLHEVRGKPLPRAPLSKKELDSYRELATLLIPAAGAASTVSVLGVLRTAGQVTQPLTHEAKIVAYVVGGAIAISGGYLGYILTHSDTPRFDEGNFRKTVEDPRSWQTFASSISQCRLVKLRKASQGLTGVPPTAAVNPDELKRCEELDAKLKSRS